MDDFRYRPQQSPRTDGTMNNLVSPPRNGGPRMQPVPTHDHRTSLPRRFTTDSGRVPTLSSIAQRPPEPQEYPTAVSPPDDPGFLPDVSTGACCVRALVEHAADLCPPLPQTQYKAQNQYKAQLVPCRLPFPRSLLAQARAC